MEVQIGHCRTILFYLPALTPSSLRIATGIYVIKKKYSSSSVNYALPIGQLFFMKPYPIKKAARKPLLYYNIGDYFPDLLRSTSLR